MVSLGHRPLQVVTGSHRVTEHQGSMRSSCSSYSPWPRRIMWVPERGRVYFLESLTGHWISSSPLSSELQLSTVSIYHYTGLWDPEAAAPFLGMHPVQDLSPTFRCPDRASPLKRDGQKSLPLALPMHSAFSLKSHPTPQAWACRK